MRFRKVPSRRLLAFVFLQNAQTHELSYLRREKEKEERDNTKRREGGGGGGNFRVDREKTKGTQGLATAIFSGAVESLPRALPLSLRP